VNTQQEEKPGLLPNQVHALRTIADNAVGGLVYLPPGEGKTLVALLAPVMLGCSRALFLTQAGLIPQFNTEAALFISKGFPIEMSRFVGVESHERFSNPSGEKMLETYDPDLVIIDESVTFSNHLSARGGRLQKFVSDKAKRGIYLPVVVMDGAFMDEQLMNLWRLFLLSLKGSTPLPIDYMEAKEFCAVVDGEFASVPAHRRVAKILQPHEGETIRRAFGRHFRSRPGVVFPVTGGLQASARLESEVVVRRPPPEVLQALDQVDNWTDPSGRRFTQAPDKYRLTQQLCTGFWSQPPEEPVWYREARLDWQHTVDDYRRRRTAESDSAATLVKLLKAGEKIKALMPAWEKWSKISAQWERPPSQTFAVSSWAVDWAVSRAEPGTLIWVRYQETGEALAARGIPYFGANSDAALLEEDGSRAVAVSIQAHGRGKNLQKQNFWNNVMLEFPGKARTMDQLVARTHRYLQKKECVRLVFWTPVERQRERLLRLVGRTEADHDRTLLPFRLQLLKDYKAMLREAEGLPPEKDTDDEEEEGVA